MQMRIFLLTSTLISPVYHSIFMRGTDQFQPSMPHMAEEFQVSKSSAFGLQKKKNIASLLAINDRFGYFVGDY